VAGSAAQLSMSMLRNIVRSYTKPGQVVSDLLQAGPREDRALAFLAAGKSFGHAVGGRAVWLVLFGPVDVLHTGLAGEMGLGRFWAIIVGL